MKSALMIIFHTKNSTVIIAYFLDEICLYDFCVKFSLIA